MIISVDDLRFRYPRNGDDVLQGLEFNVAEGEVFGFLGPNGSGQEYHPEDPDAYPPRFSRRGHVFGQPLARQTAEYYNRIGVSFEFPNLYEKLTAEENLVVLPGVLRGSDRRSRGAARSLDLPVGDRRPVAAYSKGMNCAWCSPGPCSIARSCGFSTSPDRPGSAPRRGHTEPDSRPGGCGCDRVPDHARHERRRPPVRSRRVDRRRKAPGSSIGRGRSS